MGMGMDPTVRTLMDWLQGQTNRSIMIQKKEDRDLDRVRLTLAEVGYRPDDRSIDGYTEGNSLVLHGRGTVRTETGEAPLPQDRYVIPVDGLRISKASEDGVILQTDRAHYALSPDLERVH
ncbi:hypothetical protein GE107_07965 [Cohnella sp. CFH 77786]|uniref:hypothetical protein n=1 Tax=Cohnella sp. CFH 77786 TaxID=2662265 RepID=UPI001C60FB37|nr:hypothetical protein [Cohnella sp. CFH 77786]MBW5445994.1 hypothetical protein [Cohnella sp. CFH 77786]